MARDWTLPELAETLNLDPSYLARIFKLSVGVPPIGYLATLRAEAAAELLARTDLPCAEVGDRVGWMDANYFSRRFRQHFGKSPSRYRDRSSLS
jgi:two-component system response regulator YesN